MCGGGGGGGGCSEPKIGAQFIEHLDKIRRRESSQ